MAGFDDASRRRAGSPRPVRRRGATLLHPDLGVRVMASLLSFILCVVPARAQITHSFDIYEVTQWTMQHGLSTNVTTGVAPDPDGFLWVSTLSGLARFDGVRFERFEPSTTPGLTSSITFVTTDARGVPLFRSEDQVLRHDHRRFTPLSDSLWAQRTHQTFQADDGRLLLSTRGRRSVLLDDNAMPHPLEDGYDIGGIDRQGRVWLCNPQNIVCFENGREIARHPMPTAVIPRFASAIEDGMLFHSTETLYFATLESLTVLPFEDAMAPDLLELENEVDFEWEPRRIVTDAAGRTWLGTSAGLFRCERFPLVPGLQHAAGTTRVLPYDLTGPVDDIYEDDQGALWVASRHGGLFRLRPSLAQPIASTRLWDRIHRRAAWQHQTPWIHFSPADNPNTQLLRNVEGTVYALLRDDDRVVSPAEAAVEGAASVWVSWDRHLTRYQGGEAVQRIALPVTVERGRLLSEDDQGALLWMNGYQLVRWSTTGLDTVAAAISGMVRRTADGSTWFVNDTGLHRYRQGSITHIEQLGTRGIHYYRDILVRPDGSLWIATRGDGLALIQGDELRVARVEHGLPDNTVGGFVEDDQGRLWVNSNRGVFVVPIAALEAFGRGDTSWLPCRLMTQVESASHQAARGTDGRVYFDTMDGIVAIDPQQLPPAPAAPTAQIIDVRTDEPVDFGEPRIALPLGDRTLTVRYTAASLNEGPHLRFRYRLESQAPWTEAGLQRQVVFSDLRPGVHHFEVQAAGTDGNWSPQSAGLTIRVPATFRETIWFQLLLWSVVLGVLFVWYRMRSRARERQLAVVEAEVQARRLAEEDLRLMGQRLLSAQEDERRRIARELHDDFSQRLALLSVKLDTLGPDAAESSKELAESCRSVSSDIRRMSHSLHPAKLEQLGLAKSLDSLCREITHSTGIEVSYEAHGEIDPVDPDVAVCIYRIAQGALGNAARHSGSSWAAVELLAEENTIRLSVIDGGRGFDGLASGSHSLGLISMSERAMGIGGSLEIDSSREDGTTVLAILPRKPGGA